MKTLFFVSTNVSHVRFVQSNTLRPLDSFSGGVATIKYFRGKKRCRSDFVFTAKEMMRLAVGSGAADGRRSRSGARKPNKGENEKEQESPPAGKDANHLLTYRGLKIGAHILRSPVFQAYFWEGEIVVF
jgi:hypothetical protein